VENDLAQETESATAQFLATREVRRKLTEAGDGWRARECAGERRTSPDEKKPAHEAPANRVMNSRTKARAVGKVNSILGFGVAVFVTGVREQTGCGEALLRRWAPWRRRSD